MCQVIVDGDYSVARTKLIDSGQSNLDVPVFSHMTLQRISDGVSESRCYFDRFDRVRCYFDRDEIIGVVSLDVVNNIVGIFGCEGRVVIANSRTGKFLRYAKIEIYDCVRGRNEESFYITDIYNINQGSTWPNMIVVKYVCTERLDEAYHDAFKLARVGIALGSYASGTFSLMPFRTTIELYDGLPQQMCVMLDGSSVYLVAIDGNVLKTYSVGITESKLSVDQTHEHALCSYPTNVLQHFYLGIHKNEVLGVPMYNASSHNNTGFSYTFSTSVHGEDSDQLMKVSYYPDPVRGYPSVMDTMSRKCFRSVNDFLILLVCNVRDLALFGVTTLWRLNVHTKEWSAMFIDMAQQPPSNFYCGFYYAAIMNADTLMVVGEIYLNDRHALYVGRALIAVPSLKELSFQRLIRLYGSVLSSLTTHDLLAVGIPKSYINIAGDVV